jgi:glycosyltransferase involved in cell wall biosynthesis
MLLHKSVAHDTRVQREAGALSAAGHEVTVVHLPPPEESAPLAAPALGEAAVPSFRLRSATLRRGRQRLPHRIRLGTEATRLALRAASSEPDAIHAHDAAMLLPGLLAARRAGAQLVYDSHELATGVPYRDRTWSAMVAAAERIGAPRADAVIAVSDGIATRLSERYPLRTAPTVIRNLPDLPPPGATPAPDLRRQLGVGEAPLVLHQGAVAAGRGGETLVRALAGLEDAHLLLLGAEGPYAERLAGLAGELGIDDRVHLWRPVPPSMLLSHTAQADVGVSLLEDSCENHRLALPNKLFEYLAAGLPVVVSDLPEAAKLVRSHAVGWCADPADPQSVAAALRAALAQRRDAALRGRVERAASELTWKQEKQRLLDLYRRLALAKPADGRR